MIGHIWCHSIAQNDRRGILNLSGLEEFLRDTLQSYIVGEAMLLPAVYGDSIYVPSEVIVNRGYNNVLYFRRINSLRVKIEYMSLDCLL